ncbi:TetR/AcrR family transcriptional regulator [Sandaracinus amylolyticus]|uniref:TetR/AcrR family transcriptional regulator n=1 Tax=Sandaracinus amylolyticus TaxID=927083 RepID=UPI00069F6FF5|nr:TetR/AcrR family transcriptional regulator [Sandaracinus amylolyticus]
MPRTADEHTWGGQELGERHREVLRAALHLFAERGYAGASLRELARRLGMQQPSLYHYFRSKEELVDQILTTFGFGGVQSVPEGTSIPDRVEDLPRALGDIVQAMYERTDWPIFVRFLFNLSLEQPLYAERLRVMFVETVGGLFTTMLSHYVESGQVDQEEIELLSRMVVNAIGLLYIEQYVVFPKGAGRGHEMRPYIDFVVRVAELALASRGPDGRIFPPTSEKPVATPPARGGRRTRGRGRPAER